MNVKMLSIFVVLLGLGIANGKNIPDQTNNRINSRNMITVPPNCPPGQQLVNGVCRDIWRRSNPVTVRMNINPQNVAVTQRSNIHPQNVITVPTNCPDGQQLVNGVCRDIWRKLAVTQRSNIHPQNVITVPTNCPDGQQLVNGVCRDIWKKLAVTDVEDIHMRNIRQTDGVEEINEDTANLLLKMDVDRNIINIPNQCPDGFRPDANGICRETLP